MNNKILELYDRIMIFIDEKIITVNENFIIPRLSENCLFLDQSLDGIVYLFISIHYCNKNEQWIYMFYSNDSNQFETIRESKIIVDFNDFPILKFCLDLTSNKLI